MIRKREKLFVEKRSGKHEEVHWEKISNRLQKLSYGLDTEFVDLGRISQKVVAGAYPGIKTSQLDELAADTAAYLTTEHPDYSILAGRIAVSNLHKQTSKSFFETIKILYECVNVRTGKKTPLISDSVFEFIRQHAETLDSSIKYARDYDYDFFAIKTLEKSYLLKVEGKIVERPQHMLMRVACGIHTGNIECAIETYEYLSQGWFTHASPTLFNAGTPRPQLSSCFLLTMKGDSIEGIYDTLKDTALLSKHAGGIGLSISGIRAAGSYIAGTNGTSNGIIPMLRVFNNTARYVDQCFAPETMVYTFKGPMMIQNIKVGDKVLSANGSFNKIEKVLQYNYQGHILKIKNKKNYSPVYVTPEHQIFALKWKYKDLNFDNIKYSLQKGLLKIDLIDTKDLQINDFVCFPVSVKETWPDIYDFIHDGMMYTQITDIQHESYLGQVYDFEVECEHTYVTALGAVHNGGGKRKGVMTMYLEPWHADIESFLMLRKNHGDPEQRARDLFYALWMPDLFMRRVKDDEMWSLFCPHEAPGLMDVYGKEFDDLYLHYEKEGKALKTLKARVLWDQILLAQIESGQPFLLFKDSCNFKSNQKNLGTIYSSNLCTEIIQFSSPSEIAVCNLASIALPKFVVFDKETNKPSFNHTKLFEVVVIAIKNLNRLIDINFYPNEESRRSNLKHRNLAVGTQGQADTFILMRLPYESKEAQQLNKEIYETIYFAALTASHELAKKEGHYESYMGSPLSKGQFQFDLWESKNYASGRWDWEKLRQSILKDNVGVRNSLLVALMPTASTSQILGNTECFEPINSNLYIRRTLAGEFICISKYLLKDLIKLGIWTPVLKNQLESHNGSIQKLDLPQNLKDLYKTVWEMNRKTLIDMAADRAIFIDQSQSFNVFIASPSKQNLSDHHFYAWTKGLKTGMYYLRTQAAADPIKFALDLDPSLSFSDQKKKNLSLTYSKISTTTTTTDGVCKKRKKMESEQDSQSLSQSPFSSTSEIEECTQCSS